LNGRINLVLGLVRLGRLVARHPRTGETVWFNHAIFFHVTTLEKALSEVLLDSFEVWDLPNNTFYGDGSPIEPDVLDEIREAYLQECVAYDWREGDVLLIGNMLTAHARAPYMLETGRYLLPWRSHILAMIF
jgi:alpha-ketoglutarate-dependent taurine dioxygenase